MTNNSPDNKSFQTVGTLLVFGMLVGPPATAALVVRTVPLMMLTAAVIGVLSVVIGIAGLVCCAALMVWGSRR